MQKTFIPLLKKQPLANGFRQAFSFPEINVFLVQIKNKSYLFENKCGHFGVVLDEAKIEGLESDQVVIICNQHGISFDLSTGKVVNRSWENCDPLRILDIAIEGDMMGFYL
ncbi:MAG: Rieske 2Fe-2S domain-containing protein [Pseudomonadota bacterium]